MNRNSQGKVTFTDCESVNEKKQKVLFWSKSENFAKKFFWFTDSQSRFTDSQTKFTVPEFLKILQCEVLLYFPFIKTGSDT